MFLFRLGRSLLSPHLLHPSPHLPISFPLPIRSLSSTSPSFYPSPSSPLSSWYFPPFSPNTLSSTAFQMASPPSPTSPSPTHQALTHSQLRRKAKILSKILLQHAPTPPPTHPLTVAFILSPSPSLPLLLLSIWEGGGVGVGVGVSQPEEEVGWLVRDGGCGVVVVDRDTWERLYSSSSPSSLSSSSFPAQVVLIDHLFEELEREEEKEKDEEEGEGERKREGGGAETALLCYTSGTTGRPKGVKVTHTMLESQIRSISTAWEITNKDHFLNTLPLHHMHGLVNMMLCPLFAGGTVSFVSRFEPKTVWNHLLCPKLDINVFSAVPTMYHRLLKEASSSSLSPSSLTSLSTKMRLSMSGSAACPKTVKEDWENLTGINLLERYGMTETGMLLSQDLHDPIRPVGSVGFPLPGVKVEILERSEEGEEEKELVLEKGLKERGWDLALGRIQGRGRMKGEEEKVEGEEGEEIVGTLVVKGDNVFESYWNRPSEMTAKEFTKNGEWFITGDSVSFSPRNGFKILGRNSIDIIKSSGVKISALEIERVVLDHPLVDEVAVVGVEEEERGECVVAIVTLISSGTSSFPSLSSSSCSSPGLSSLVEAPEEMRESVRREGRKGLAPYKLPRRVFVWRNQSLPKNSVGKVDKKEIKRMVVAVMKGEKGE